MIKRIFLTFHGEVKYQNMPLYIYIYMLRMIEFIKRYMYKQKMQFAHKHMLGYSLFRIPYFQQ